MVWLPQVWKALPPQVRPAAESIDEPLQDRNGIPGHVHGYRRVDRPRVLPCIPQQDSIQRTFYDPYAGRQSVGVGEVVQEHEEQRLDNNGDMGIAYALDQYIQDQFAEQKLFGDPCQDHRTEDQFDGWGYVNAPTFSLRGYQCIK